MATVEDIPRVAGRIDRVFGSTEFFRLWLAQVVSATGDWLGLVAISALAIRVGAGSEGASVSLVLSARIVPGFFLASFAGVLVDRWNRRHVMVVCDIGRAIVLATLPFVDSIFGLVVASLILEIFTLLWSPAKEASVPHLVPEDKLAAANSLSLVAAYGTFPLAAGLFALLSKFSTWLGDNGWVDTLRLNEEGLAFYVDALSFLVTAALIFTLTLPVRPKTERDGAPRPRFDLTGAFRDLTEGWSFVVVNPIVRAVNVGLATGLIGGGMLVPLGAIFAQKVLDEGETGYGVFIFSLGMGVAVGVLAVSVLQSRLQKEWTFTAAVVAAGAALVVASSVSTLLVSAPFVFVIGMCAGAVYVLGFTLLHENVDDELRGRIFSALYSLVRMCVLLAFAVGPLLEQYLDDLSAQIWDRTITVAGMDLFVPGVRLTLWLAGVIIIVAGALSGWSLRAGTREEPT